MFHNPVFLRAAGKRALCLVLLLFALILTWRTAWIVSGTLLDSDASSELILGEKLAREGGILSSTWYYSTELRVVYNQLIYSLLFRLTGHWFTVRFAGAVIMQLLLLGAYGFLARQARMSFNAFCVTGAAMLLPFSVPYGRIVLYHNYYIFHLILALCTVGLYLRVLRRDLPRTGPLRTALRGGALCVTALAAGLGGVRQLMICDVPLCVAALLTALSGEKGDDAPNRLRRAAPSLIWALAAAAAGTAGYLINSQVLANLYHFKDYGQQTLALVSVSGLEEIFRGFLASLSVKDGPDLFSLRGLLSVGTLAAVFLALAGAFHLLRHGKEDSARLLSALFLSELLVMTCVFAFLAGGDWFYELYYLPSVFWILPALGAAEIRPAAEEAPAPKAGRKPRGASSGTGRKAAPGPLARLRSAPERKALAARLLGEGSPRLTVRGLTALLSCILLLANGVYFTGFFRNPAAYAGEVEYAGLRVSDTGTVAALRPMAEELKARGFTLCYAPYWTGAVLTELTDGQLRSCPVEEGTRKKPIRYRNWLSDANLRDPAYAAAQKVCLVADLELDSAVSSSDRLSPVLTPIGSWDEYTVYELTDPAFIANMLN